MASKECVMCKAKVAEVELECPVCEGRLVYPSMLKTKVKVKPKLKDKK